MPIDYSEYPDNWFTELRPVVLSRANNCCEGSPQLPACREKNHMPHSITGSKVVLTIAHMDHDKTNNSLENLRALCQRCHLRHDIGQHVANRKYGRYWKRDQLSLFNGAPTNTYWRRSPRGSDGVGLPDTAKNNLHSNLSLFIAYSQYPGPVHQRIGLFLSSNYPVTVCYLSGCFFPPEVATT